MYAGGIIVLREAMILIQEEQSTGAWLRAASSTAAGRLPDKVVQAEVEKMQANVQLLRPEFPELPGLCLLVSDFEIETCPTLPTYCMPCGVSSLEILLGDTIVRVRACDGGMPGRACPHRLRAMEQHGSARTRSVARMAVHPGRRIRRECSGAALLPRIVVPMLRTDFMTTCITLEVIIAAV